MSSPKFLKMACDRKGCPTKRHVREEGDDLDCGLGILFSRLARRNYVCPVEGCGRKVQIIGPVRDIEVEE